MKTSYAPTNRVTFVTPKPNTDSMRRLAHMPCKHGRELHKEFELAAAARIAIEQRIGPRLGSEKEHALRIENSALMVRTFHVTSCEECRPNPPRSSHLPASGLPRACIRHIS